MVKQIGSVATEWTVYQIWNQKEIHYIYILQNHAQWLDTRNKLVLAQLHSIVVVVNGFFLFTIDFSYATSWKIPLTWLNINSFFFNRLVLRHLILFCERISIWYWYKVDILLLLRYSYFYWISDNVMLGDFADHTVYVVTCCFLSGNDPTSFQFMIIASTPFLIFDDVAIHDSNRT